MPRLGVAGGVAQAIEDHDRVRGELQVVGHVVLAVILRVRVAVARRGVQAHAVLGVGRERRIRAGPAVPVAEVHQDVGALRHGLHAVPGGVRAVQLIHGGAVRAGLRRVALRAGDVVRSRRVGGADHDDDLVAGGGRRSGDAQDAGQCDEGRDGCHGERPDPSIEGRPLGALGMLGQQSCLLPAGTACPEHVDGGCGAAVAGGARRGRATDRGALGVAERSRRRTRGARAIPLRKRAPSGASTRRGQGSCRGGRRVRLGLSVGLGEGPPWGSGSGRV